MPTKHIKMVEVEFVDVQNGNGWWHFDRKKHKTSVKTLPACGLLVDRGPDFLVLAFSYNHDAGDFVGEFTIPTPIVRRVKVLGTKTFPK